MLAANLVVHSDARNPNPGTGNEMLSSEIRRALQADSPVRFDVSSAVLPWLQQIPVKSSRPDFEVYDYSASPGHPVRSGAYDVFVYHLAKMRRSGEFVDDRPREQIWCEILTHRDEFLFGGARLECRPEQLHLRATGALIADRGSPDRTCLLDPDDESTRRAGRVDQRVISVQSGRRSQVCPKELSEQQARTARRKSQNGLLPCAAAVSPMASAAAAEIPITQNMMC